ncbi:hypothetical protein D9613_008931 [Agrocybe pediades]|uniref:Uncharacterized protein n=1 Tax=Agrocybe pediades TaxID=84607 RepID=A0A8H4VQW4_9AGAR|nr:hypothetical protein D9613_008931 [Agrocybe pediades]
MLCLHCCSFSQSSTGCCQGAGPPPPPPPPPPPTHTTTKTTPRPPTRTPTPTTTPTPENTTTKPPATPTPIPTTSDSDDDFGFNTETDTDSDTFFVTPSLSIPSFSPIGTFRAGTSSIPGFPNLQTSLPNQARGRDKGGSWLVVGFSVVVAAVFF